MWVTFVIYNIRGKQMLINPSWALHIPTCSCIVNTNNINILFFRIIIFRQNTGFQVCIVIYPWTGTTATAKVPAHLSTWWRALAVFTRTMTMMITIAAHPLYLSHSPQHLGTAHHHESTSRLLTRLVFIKFWFYIS